MGLEEWVVPGIAIYGAILSTLIYIQKWRENRPNVRVSHYFGRNPSEKIYVTLVVKNFGKQPITLSHAYLEEYQEISFMNKLKGVNKEKIRSDRNYLNVEGKEVKSGKECKIDFNYQYNIPSGWGNTRKKCTGIVVDQLENKYESTIIEL